MILIKCPLSAMQANRSKYICLVRILKLWSGIFFKLSNYKVYYYNINRQMRVIIIETKSKMGYLKSINSYGLNIKSVSDDFDGLTVILENNELELFSIRWANVKSYCRSTEEMRFKFIAGEWQQV